MAFTGRGHELECDLPNRPWYRKTTDWIAGVMLKYGIFPRLAGKLLWYGFEPIKFN